LNNLVLNVGSKYVFDQSFGEWVISEDSYISFLDGKYVFSSDKKGNYTKVFYNIKEFYSIVYNIIVE
jgi:hypothetical protein